ncbi:MAG: O-antigen ligase family protein [Burkholderiales bacterium]
MALDLQGQFVPHWIAKWRSHDPSSAADSVPQTSRTKPSLLRKAGVLAAIALVGAVWGGVVAVAGVNALFLCVSLIGCAFILRDFRIGVALLIVLMPISRSWMFPHAMLGVTGLNPFNLLLVATVGSLLLHGLSEKNRGPLVPRPLLWLYIVPIIAAGVLGSGHVNEIPSFLLDGNVIEFENASGYFRDMVMKPLIMVVFALVVGAAMARSDKPERFLYPAVAAIWVMSAMVIVFVLLSGTSLKDMAGSESREVLSALGMHANALGRLYVSAYALLLFTWAESKNSAFRLALLVSMVVVVVALVLTFSRGAFLSFIVVNVLYLVWRRNARTWMLFGLLAACVLVALPGAVYERVLMGVGSGSVDTISAGRIDYLWLPLLPELARSPIYGHGLGSIMWSEPMRTGGGITFLPVEHPHNAYLQAVLDMGIIGLILLCAYFWHVWKNFRALSRDAGLNPTLRGFYAGSAAGLASLLLSYATDSSLTPGVEQSFLWFSVGMMYGHASIAFRSAHAAPKTRAAMRTDPAGPGHVAQR